MRSINLGSGGTTGRAAGWPASGGRESGGVCCVAAGLGLACGGHGCPEGGAAGRDTGGRGGAEGRGIPGTGPASPGNGCLGPVRIWPGRGAGRGFAGIAPAFCPTGATGIAGACRGIGGGTGGGGSVAVERGAPRGVSTAGGVTVGWLSSAGTSGRAPAPASGGRIGRGRDACCTGAGATGSSAAVSGPGSSACSSGSEASGRGTASWSFPVNSGSSTSTTALDADRASNTPG